MGRRQYRGTTGAGKEKWGPGAQWKSVESFEVGRFGVAELEHDKAIASALMHGGGTEQFEIFHGQHPHSRSDNKTYARGPQIDVVSFSGTRLRTRVEVHEYNYLKSSGISGDDIRQMCQCTIYFFDRAVYGFHTREAPRALLKAALIIPELAEHPVDWRKVNDKGFADLIGRKIMVNQEKAVVSHYFPDQGSFVARPDGAKRFLFADRLEITNDGGESWKDDLLTPYAHVRWFRDAEDKPRKGKGK